jgi:hypothetical protein
MGSICRSYDRIMQGAYNTLFAALEVKTSDADERIILKC